MSAFPKIKEANGPTSVFSRLSDEDLDAAAAWLDFNEGEHGEKESCHRVAEALRAEVERREEDRKIKVVAKENGVPATLVRSALRKIAKEGK
jgi:hypothetical protein